MEIVSRVRARANKHGWRGERRGLACRQQALQAARDFIAYRGRDTALVTFAAGGPFSFVTLQALALSSLPLTYLHHP